MLVFGQSTTVKYDYTFAKDAAPNENSLRCYELKLGSGEKKKSKSVRALSFRRSLAPGLQH